MNNVKSVVAAIDWKKNIGESFPKSAELARVEASLLRLAIWSKQFETVDNDNPCLCFMREMQSSALHCVALISLGLYKDSAARARTMLETTLYYSYFRTHLEELTTLVSNENYYMSKTEIMDYHKLHTVKFAQNQSLFDISGNLRKWYSETSSIVHGQIPGKWGTPVSLSAICYNDETFEAAVDTFVRGERLVYELLLCTVGKHFWSSFSPDAKSHLLKGLPGEKKTALQLDAK